MKCFLILIGFGLIGFNCAFCADDPIYQGKHLSTWLGQLRDRNSSDQAREAIRQIGTNGLPFYLNEMHVLGEAWKKEGTNFYTNPELRTHLGNVGFAFKILGPMAKPATPELIKILNSGKLSDVAAEALIAADSSSAAIWLTQALTNKDYYVSCAAANHLFDLGTNAEVAVPRLLECLKDKSPSHVRGSANLRWFSAVALGGIHKDSEKVVSALIQAMQQDDDISVRFSSARALSYFELTPEINTALVGALQKDESWFVRLTAANSLASFTTNAIGAIPALLQVSTNDTDKRVRSAAIGALKKIQPVALPRKSLDNL